MQCTISLLVHITSIFEILPHSQPASQQMHIECVCGTASNFQRYILHIPQSFQSFYGFRKKKKTETVSKKASWKNYIQNGGNFVVL